MHDSAFANFPLALLEATVARHVATGARIVAIEPRPIGAGLSGAAVRRYQVTLDGPEGRRAVRLVTKEASSAERRAVALLNGQGQPSVPFGHALDPDGEAPALLCLEDLGDEHRPSSLSPIPAEVFRREAAGLAAIHAANLGGTQDLGWLPRLGREAVAEAIERAFFRPAWERALAEPDFRRDFGAAIAPVERHAAAVADEMAALHAEDDAVTLVHTDINPSNVLLRGGRAYFVDWQDVHAGSLYVDLPHHFDTLARAEVYRVALAERGVAIPPGHFAKRYRIAARYTGLRYCWWALDAWREDRAMAPWVAHYLAMITG
ncbi:MAG: hypothetical protein AVDCRST_MAG49-3129 [uncultured Thermomicrobiales bacterium]|uniref:Aminoglycoside phosphotransferase domain-containing protein n=1 Tax=uncultured Thermomicrobiales bacterium TaxID=1645740 RepID=A0A6J4V7M7_9BACT|nr:MAG: hypothetical protein AVDCRST_MAG49-3129 [uncultured Thermomicrobiales bacterium]